MNMNWGENLSIEKFKILFLKDSFFVPFPTTFFPIKQMKMLCNPYFFSSLPHTHVHSKMSCGSSRGPVTLTKPRDADIMTPYTVSGIL